MTHQWKNDGHYFYWVIENNDLVEWEIEHPDRCWSEDEVGWVLLEWWKGPNSIYVYSTRVERWRDVKSVR